MTRVYSIQKWTLVFLLIGTSLFFNPLINTDVFEFPKVLTLIISVGFLTLVNLFEIYKEWPPKVKLQKIKIPLVSLGIFFFSQIIAYIFSTDSDVSLIGAHERYQGFLIQINYIFLFLNSFYFFIKNHSAEKEIAKWIFILTSLVSAFAILPYIFPLTFPFYYFTPSFFFDRVYGTFGNPNYLAVFIISTIPFIVFAQYSKKYFKWISLLFTIVALFLTGSRSAWLAIFVTFLGVGIYLAVVNKKFKILIISGAIFTLFILVVFNKNYLSQYIPQFERLSLDSEKSTSIQTRVHLWKAGIVMSIKRPLQGYGQDMIQENIEAYLPQYLKSNNQFFVDRSHNEFIDILITTGIFGALSYLFLLSSIIYRSFKKFQGKFTNIPLSFITGLLALTIFHALNFSTISSNVLLYFYLGYLSAYISKGQS